MLPPDFVQADLSIKGRIEDLLRLASVCLNVLKLSSKAKTPSLLLKGGRHGGGALRWNEGNIVHLALKSFKGNCTMAGYSFLIRYQLKFLVLISPQNL